MLFDEFVEGTGCRETDYNYKIYKRLELMYMADESISKEEIYEYGKKLVDNSKNRDRVSTGAEAQAGECRTHAAHRLPQVRGRKI